MHASTKGIKRAMVVVLPCAVAGGEARTIAWPCGIERHYERSQLHREGGPAVVVRKTFEAWYQRGDPHRIGAAAIERVMARCSYSEDEPSEAMIRVKYPKSQESRVKLVSACIALRSWHKEKEWWANSRYIEMIDAFVFTFEIQGMRPEATEPPDYWFCEERPGELYFIYTPMCIGRILTDGLYRRPPYTPTDSLSCSLTDFYLTCLAAERMMNISGCDKCKAMVLTPHTGDSDVLRSACDACKPRS
jgi:hypothetical protein